VRTSLPVVPWTLKRVVLPALTALTFLWPRPGLPQTTQDPVLSVAGAYARGDSNAKLTVIEFMDYQCPVCAWHVREALPQIEKEYIATGKVRYVLRDYPLHPLAFKAAEAARCAGDQQKYWEMHERLLAHQNALRLDDLSGHARALGLDMPNFQQCLDTGKHAEAIRKDMADGQKAGVKGTPTFFIGITEPNDTQVKVLRTIPGAQLYTGFKFDLESLYVSPK
jgi:protein-disulfide isomerase